MKLLLFLIISFSSPVNAELTLGSATILNSNTAYSSSDHLNTENFNHTAPVLKKKTSLKERLLAKIAKSKLNKFLRKADKGDKNITAILSLSFALLAIVVLFFSVEALIYVSIAASIAAIVLGIISPKKNGKRDWKAITGLILGILELLLLFVLVIIVSAIVIGAFGSI